MHKFCFSFKVFDANVDSIDSVTNVFDQPFLARYVRVHAATWFDTPRSLVTIAGCSYIQQGIVLIIVI